MLCLLVALIASDRAFACDNSRTLSEITNRAAEKIRRGSRLAALGCYREATSQMFAGATPDIQERYLREYLDHTRRLALRAPKGPKRAQYLDESAEVALRYINWYHAAGKQAGRTHIAAVIVYLGEGLENIQQHGKLVREYAAIAASHPEIFTIRSIELWEDNLRVNPENGKPVKDDELRAFVHGHIDIKRQWEAFRDFLLAAERRPELRAVAREKLVRANDVLA